MMIRVSVYCVLKLELNCVLVYMFGVPFAGGKYMQGDVKFSEAECQLSRRMMNYWANFARSGNPGWSQYS